MHARLPVGYGYKPPLITGGAGFETPTVRATHYPPPMGYEFTWVARSSSIDETNHLYYPKLFEYVDNGIEALLEAIDYPLSKLIPQEGRALPIVHVEADYLAPIAFGDTVACTLSPEVGDASVRFHATGTVNGDRVFEATIVRVLVDLDSFEKRSVPTGLRTELTRLSDA